MSKRRKKSSQKKPFLRPFLKTLISFGIIYHLVMIVVLPHYRFKHHKKLLPYYYKYQYALSLKNIWSLYSLKLLPRFYFEYEVTTRIKKPKGKKKKKKDPAKTYYWPMIEKNRLSFNHNRLLTHSLHLMNMGPVGVHRYFLPFLCSLHPEARHVKAKAMAVKKDDSKKRKRRSPRPKELFSTSKRCPKKKITR